MWVATRTNSTGAPNTPLELTPLRGPEIVRILKASITLSLSRSIQAAQLSGRPLGGGSSVPVLDATYCSNSDARQAPVQLRL